MDFHRNFAFLILTLFFLSACSENAEDSQDSMAPPNIIYIMADDLGYGDLGVYGQTKIKTPRLDQMAKEGMVFTQFYAGTSVCAPSRSSLITGLHTGHTEIRGNYQYRLRNGQYPLSEGTTTLAGVLKEAGYKTGMIGKWGLGDPNTDGNPLNHGWDFFYGYTDQVLAHNYYPEYLWKNNEKIYLDNEVQYLDSSLWHDGLGSYSTVKNEYSNDLFFAEASAFLKENASNPFFLYLPLTIPHDNGEQSDTMRWEVPDQGIYADKPWSKNERDYAAMITQMDSCIGALLQQLQELGIDQNTIVLFTSDNGPYKDHPVTEFFDSNGPLRGFKRDLYEGGIRVPLIVRWPETIAAGQSTDHVSAFWDILPSFAELAGAEVPTEIDGLSMASVFTGGEVEKHDVMYWEFHEGTGAQAVLKDQWKAIRNDAITNPHNDIELYNLSTDLGEENNVAADHPDIVKMMDSLMLASRTHSEVFPFYGDAFKN